MDFVRIKEKSVKKDLLEVYPEFLVKKSDDLMIRGKDFYAVWNEDTQLWSQSPYDVQTLVDKELYSYRDRVKPRDGEYVSVRSMKEFSSTSWMTFCKYATHLADNYHQLDEKIVFADTEVKKEDYISRRLPYSLTDGDHSAFDTILETLYDEEERNKILWIIGSIVSGDSRKIQKFAVLYGAPGTGKGTVIDIVKKLFGPYCVSIKTKNLVTNADQFATDIFRTNPLVCVDPDSKLDHIEDNTVLNTLVSHETMIMKEKFKASYNGKSSAFLLLGSNTPVMISDANSGLIRRLIDIFPSGRKITPEKRYWQLMNQVDFELGAIAKYCLDIYEKTGPERYNGYRPISMMYKTDPFFNFVKEKYLEYKKEDGVSLKNAYTQYKEYCEDSQMKRKEMYKFKDELKNYFRNFEDLARVDGKQVRSWYSGFRTEKFEAVKIEPTEKEDTGWLKLDKTESLLDVLLAEYPAQYASDSEIPTMAWDRVKTKLKDLDTKKLHYTMGPADLINVDFDLKNEKGEKDREANLKAASKWPKTYAEYSKSGCGIHLVYFYAGDTGKLKSRYGPDIEIKTFTGKSSLRRKLSYCNDIPVTTLSSGLPEREEKVVSFTGIENDKHLIALVEKALRKEIEPGATKTSIDFIDKILSDAYEQGLSYDISEYRDKITKFAAQSSHQAAYCLTKVCGMKFMSKDHEKSMLADLKADENDILTGNGGTYDDDRIAFFDLEVFPNLLLVNWKWAGETICQRLINPEPKDIEPLLKLKLVGFNCRRYDNHILYARYIGKTIDEIYDISRRIVNGSRDAMYGNAYNLSYTDVYDFCSKKQSLKKWEIELGFHHQELGMKWDEPVPVEKWAEVAEYCDNDVFATEAVFNARQADWTARQILADIAGMTVNDTTNSLTTQIIFGGDRSPQSQFNYRDMGDEKQIRKNVGSDGFTAFDEHDRPIFPGYRFENGKSLYRGEDVGSGGYVYAEPGVYTNVALLDIASMHPSSIVAEELFGPDYTKRFHDILNARILIKHKEYDKAAELFDGKLKGYLSDESQAKALAGALKIAINSVYGLTSATFNNPFRDIRNVDNIVAKRGALFMVNLKHFVQDRGFTVAHIKTDSIKIPNATDDIIREVTDYGKMYGYSFEHEATYDRMCLVNDAVYIARYSDSDPEYARAVNDAKAAGKSVPTPWTATGTQFQVPYVFKTLFSHEPIVFDDLCETKTVTSALYLDFNEKLPDVSEKEKQYEKLGAEIRKKFRVDPEVEGLIGIPKELLDEKEWLEEEISKGHNYVFIGRAGQFCPVKKGCGGGWLVRDNGHGYSAVTGTKGYRWKEAEAVRTLGMEDQIDRGYFDEMAEKAKDAIRGQGADFEMFVSDGPFVPLKGISHGKDIPPWCLPCGEEKYETCFDCPRWDPLRGECGGR